MKLIPNIQNARNESDMNFILAELDKCKEKVLNFELMANMTPGDKTSIALQTIIENVYAIKNEALKQVNVIAPIKPEKKKVKEVKKGSRAQEEVEFQVDYIPQTQTG